MAKYSHFIVFLCLIFSVDWSMTEVEITLEPVAEPLWFMEYHTLNFSCIVKNSKEKAKLFYASRLVDNKYLKETALPDGTQIINFYKDEATIDDAGYYYCEAETMSENIRADYITVVARDVNLTLGFSTSISCTIQPSGYDTKSVRWQKGNVPISDIPQLQHRVMLSGFNETLTISSSKPTDAGQYTCIIVYNPGTSIEQVFTEHPGILGKPYMVETGNKPLVKKMNASVILECPAAGYPLPEVFWLLNEEVIQPSSLYDLQPMNGVPNARLVINDPNDRKTYMCAAENNLGKSSMTFENDRNGGSTLHASVVWLMFVGVLILGTRWED